MMYFDQEDGMLTFDGHVHLHLLLAKHLKLKRVSYEWDGMPLVVKKTKRKVFGNREELGKVVKLTDRLPRQLMKGHGNRCRK